MNDSLKLLLDFFFIAGLFASGIILFLLFKKPKKELPHRILIVFFLVLFLVNLNFYAYLHKIKSLFYATFLVEDIAILVVGPLLFLYIKSLYEKSEGLIKRNFLHFITGLIYLFAISIPLMISIISKKPYYSYIETIDAYHEYFVTGLGIYFLIYCLLSLRLLSKSQKAIKENFSTIESKDFRWVRHMVIGCIIVISVDLATSIIELVQGAFDWQSGYLTIIAMIILIIYLGFYGTAQSKILLPTFLIPDNADAPEKKSVQHHLSNTSAEDIESLKNALLQALEKEKAYLDDELTLGKLAQMIPTTDKKLSALLNQYMDTSFYDLINKNRVEAVKAKIEAGDSDQYSMLGLAFDCGFKSKTSFNRVFKKETGMSPSQYKKDILERNT